MKPKRELFGRNRVTVSSSVRHRIPLFGAAPEFGPDHRIESVYFAEGISNGDAFGAVVRAPGNLAPRTDMYGAVRFEAGEGATLGFTVMTMRDRSGQPEILHPEIEDAAQAEALIERLRAEGRKLYSGDMLFLDVPFAAKEEARARGARWSQEDKKWFVMSRLADLDDFRDWLSKDADAPAM